MARWNISLGREKCNVHGTLTLNLHEWGLCDGAGGVGLGIHGLYHTALSMIADHMDGRYSASPLITVKYIDMLVPRASYVRLVGGRGGGGIVQVLPYP